jgi:hypothetical protein
MPSIDWRPTKVGSKSVNSGDRPLSGFVNNPSLKKRAITLQAFGLPLITLPNMTKEISGVKSNLLLAAEWIWRQRGKDMRLHPGLLTDANPDPTAPKLSGGEANRVIQMLLEKHLLIGRIVDSQRVYIVNDHRMQEWNEFITNLRNGERPQGTASEEREVPNPTEFKKYAWYQVSKNWPHLKAAGVAIACLMALSFLAGFSFTYHLVVAAKDATIESLKTNVEGKQSKIELLEKENDKLNKKIASLPTDEKGKNQTFQVFNYTDDPNAERIKPYPTNAPAIAYDPQGKLPLYIWNVQDQLWK